MRCAVETYLKTLFTTQTFLFFLFGNLLFDALLLAWWQDGGGFGCFWFRVFFLPVVLPSRASIGSKIACSQYQYTRSESERGFVNAP